MFNQYEFIDELKSSILDDVKNITDIEDFIFNKIDNECIYYSDCFDIIKELNFTDFNHEIFGVCDNVCKAAFCALYDLVYNDSDVVEYYEELTNSVTDEL